VEVEKKKKKSKRDKKKELATTASQKSPSPSQRRNHEMKTKHATLFEHAGVVLLKPTVDASDKEMHMRNKFNH
jgi:hypothetical protein